MKHHNNKTAKRCAQCLKIKMLMTSTKKLWSNQIAYDKTQKLTLRPFKGILSVDLFTFAKICNEDYSMIT